MAPGAALAALAGLVVMPLALVVLSSTWSPTWSIVTPMPAVAGYAPAIAAAVTPH